MQNGKSAKWKNKKNKKDLKPKVFFNFLCYIDISGNIFCWVEKKLKNILEEEQVRPNHKFSLITYCIKYHLRNGS